MTGPKVSIAMVAAAFLASGVFAQTGGQGFGPTYTGYKQSAGIDGYSGVQGYFDYRPAPPGADGLLVWGGIQNGFPGQQGDCHIQVGWIRFAGSSVGQTYWEYAPDHGAFPDNYVQGFGASAPSNAYYALEKTVDLFGQDVVWIGAANGMTGLLFTSVPWEEFDDAHFCCAFFGVEVKETYSTRGPGTSNNQCCFSSLQAKSGASWESISGFTSESAYIYLASGVVGAFCVYDTRN